MAIDEAAFDEVRARIVRYATSRGCMRQDAEDLAQQTLMVLFEKYPDRPRAELVALAYKIFGHLLMNRIRSKYVSAASVQVDLLPLPDPGETPEAEFIRGERMESLARALAKLGEPCRTFIRMCLDNLSLAEIKEATGAESMNTVYTWNSRCPKYLIELLAAGGK